MNKAENNKNGYVLSRRWFDFAFEHPEVKPIHGILYLWLVELNNRLGWIEVFGIPTEVAMAAVGVGSHKTYKKAFDFLVEHGFVKIIEKSRNQYSATQVSVTYGKVENTRALDSAMVKNTRASPKQIPEQVRSTAHINKQGNNKTKKPIKPSSEVFTPDYRPQDKYDSIAYAIWKQVYEHYTDKDIIPASVVNVKVGSWRNDVRLMMEKDGRNEAEIKEVLGFLRQDDFWASNILSPGKLRKSFDQLLSKARSPRAPSQLQNTTFKESDQDYSTPINDL